MNSTDKHYEAIEFVSDCNDGNYFFLKIKKSKQKSDFQIMMIKLPYEWY